MGLYDSSCVRLGSYNNSGAWGLMEYFRISFSLASGGRLLCCAYLFSCFFFLFLLPPFVYLIIVLFFFGFFMWSS